LDAPHHLLESGIMTDALRDLIFISYEHFMEVHADIRFLHILTRNWKNGRVLCALVEFHQIDERRFACGSVWA
jgi:hypothetical protein